MNIKSFVLNLISKLKTYYSKIYNKKKSPFILKK